MKTATQMTEKQRRAIEAMEGARSEGVALSDYAKAHGLVIRELYDAIAGLRRNGLLAKPARTKGHSRFVAVRVAPERASPKASSAVSVPLCRIVQPSGVVIECTQWPSPGWLAALVPGSSDAAT
jgi:hypothetical protein